MEQEQRSARTYHQYCGVARALDLVGERWTLLIVRDLLVGPKRYKDLLVGLPGIGTNLLAARLKELERIGVVRRTTLPPPAASTVYELTDAGLGLEPVVMALGHWGGRFARPAREDDFLSATAFLVAMRVDFDRDAAAGLDETYELRVGDQVFAVRVTDGNVETSEGRPGHSVAVIRTDVATLRAIRGEGLSSDQAVAAGRVELSGDRAAFDRFVGVFGGGAPRKTRGAPKRRSR